MHGKHMNNHKIATLVLLCCTSLYGCGGGESNHTGVGHDLAASLAATSWQTSCSPYNKFPSDNLSDAWNVRIKLSINAALQASYRSEYFHPNDKNCTNMLFDTLHITTLSIKGKVMTVESIEAYALDETFSFFSGNKNLPPLYSLIYLDVEKLHFGRPPANHSSAHHSSANTATGKTPDTRHTSISLNDYFRKVIR
jgi:hypothetical protein